MTQPHITLAAEKIGTLFGLPVTNSILSTWLVMAFLTLIAYLSTRNLQTVPGKLQSVAELVIGSLHDLFKSVVGEENINRFFPLLATIFMFVIFSNWMGLLPGVGSVGVYEEEPAAMKGPIVASAPTVKVENVTVETNEGQPDHGAQPAGTEAVAESGHARKLVPLFRGPTADLNTTLAIALIAVFAIQYYGLSILGLPYLKKFINISNPIYFFIGILEIISEISRVLSFSFRLFGNIFAGEVLLTVIAFLMPVIVPLPFMGLELFVGFIQALVFSMLTAVFLNMATVAHAEH